MKEAADQDPLIAAESDYVLKDFRFSDGGSLPELKPHYRTMGQPRAPSRHRRGPECGSANSDDWIPNPGLRL